MQIERQGPRSNRGKRPTWGPGQGPSRAPYGLRPTRGYGLPLSGSNLRLTRDFLVEPSQGPFTLGAPPRPRLALNSRRDALPALWQTDSMLRMTTWRGCQKAITAPCRPGEWPRSFPPTPSTVRPTPNAVQAGIALCVQARTVLTTPIPFPAGDPRWGMGQPSNKCTDLTRHQHRSAPPPWLPPSTTWIISSDRHTTHWSWSWLVRFMPGMMNHQRTEDMSSATTPLQHHCSLL